MIHRTSTNEWWVDYSEESPLQVPGRFVSISPACPELHHSHWWCCRRRGHGGRHAAWNSAGRVLAVWGPKPSPHQRAIDGLRIDATCYRDEVLSLACAAVADLLEVHDATGINLTKFGAVTRLTERILADEGYPPLQDNGV